MTNLLSFPKQLAKFFSNQALESSFILEYGSGSSTEFLIQNKKKCMSVESDYVFFLNLLQKISIQGYALSTIPVFVDIGPTKEWGHPLDTSKQSNWHTYSLRPWEILNNAKITPDLVLIDGRFRVACMLATLANITKPTKIIFDDYVDRPYKNIIEKYCKPLNVIDRAAYFEISPGKLSAKDILCRFNSFFDPS
ncbi:hypothetical protein [Polynucleobacter difficilis]|uniref:hypothetical protein n=1 Tax=Polynucleobacter difficilis TaxID=556054 RepID=UPI000D3CB96B|nr:hypothetical protein [Polynucleobacter difficilis]